MSQTSSELTPVGKSHGRATGLTKAGVGIAIVIYVGGVIWLLEEVVVTGVQFVDAVTSGALSSAAGKVFDVLKHRVLAIRPGP